MCIRVVFCIAKLGFIACSRIAARPCSLLHVWCVCLVASASQHLAACTHYALVTCNQRPCNWVYTRFLFHVHLLPFSFISAPVSPLACAFFHASLLAVLPCNMIMSFVLFLFCWIIAFLSYCVVLRILRTLSFLRDNYVNTFFILL